MDLILKNLTNVKLNRVQTVVKHGGLNVSRSDFMEIIKTIHQIRPNLFLTSSFGAKNIGKLEELGITHVLMVSNITERVDMWFPEKFEYKMVDLRDKHDEQILDLLKDTVGWMENLLHNKGVKLLVHCAVGGSRSVTFVLAYLMHSEERTLEDTFEEVYKIRPIVGPNQGYMNQLAVYQKCIKNL